MIPLFEPYIFQVAGLRIICCVQATIIYFVIEIETGSLIKNHSPLNDVSPKNLSPIYWPAELKPTAPLKKLAEPELVKL